MNVQTVLRENGGYQQAMTLPYLICLTLQDNLPCNEPVAIGQQT